MISETQLESCFSSIVFSCLLLFFVNSSNYVVLFPVTLNSIVIPIYIWLYFFFSIYFPCDTHSPFSVCQSSTLNTTSVVKSSLVPGPTSLCKEKMAMSLPHALGDPCVRKLTLTCSPLPERRGRWTPPANPAWQRCRRVPSETAS